MNFQDTKIQRHLQPNTSPTNKQANIINIPSNTTTTTKASSSSDDIKSILLKHGLMPDYQSIQLSEELYENYIIRQI